MGANYNTRSLRQKSLPDTAYLAGVALLGLVFPEAGSFFCAARIGDLSIKGILLAQVANPIIWLLDLVPIALVAASWKSAVVVPANEHLSETTNISVLTSRIEELEMEINRRDLRLEEVGVLLDVASKIRQSLLDAISQPCLVVDLDGKITEANEAFWRLTPAVGNPNVSLYADQVLEIRTVASVDGERLKDLNLGMLAQEEILRISFRLSDVQSAFTSRIRRLGEDGGPIGSLWMLLEDQSGISADDPLVAEADGEASVEPATTIYADPSRDELTGLHNNASFLERFEEEHTRAVRYESTFSIVLIDIENFRLLNQRHGEKAGDEALLSVAAAIASCARKMDFVARYGGDVFAVLLPETPEDGSVLFAERVRKAIVQKADPEMTVTARFACATLENGQSLSEFTESARRALAHCKDSSGTRIVHAAGLAK